MKKFTKENDIKMAVKEACEISDDALDSIAGGTGDSADRRKARFDVGETVFYRWGHDGSGFLYMRVTIADIKWEYGQYYYLTDHFSRYIPEYELSRQER